MLDESTSSVKKLAVNSHMGRLLTEISRVFYLDPQVNLIYIAMYNST